MNSVLSYIAGLLVLLLFGALIGPSVVDWNSFRSGIETQISQATGRHVTIEGDINFVILPSPRFRLDAIEIRPSADAEPFARADVLEGEVALTPLLRGEVDVTRIRAQDFSISLKRDAHGQMNWASHNSDAAIGALNPADVRLDRVNFDNGHLRIEDARSGREFEFSSINGELKAGSLIGPYRFDGTFVLDEELLALSVGVGAIAGDRAFPVSIDLASERFKWASSFSGIATEASLAGRLDGTLLMQVGTPRTVDEVTEPAFLSAKSGLVVSQRQTTFRDLEVSLVGAPLKGQALLTYDAAPVLTGRLGGALLPLDALLKSYHALDLPRTRSVMPVGLSGKLDVTAAEVTYSDVRARDVSLDVGFAKGELNVNDLTGHLSGIAEATLVGVLKLENRTRRFDGTVTGSISDLAGFEKWLWEKRGNALSDGERYAPRAAGRLDFTTSLALKPSLVQAYGFSAVFADGKGSRPPLMGGFSWARQNGKPAASVELHGPYADLNFLAGFEAGLSDASAWDLSALDGNLLIKLDELKYRGLRYSDVDIAATVKEGALNIRQASAIGVPGNRRDGEMSAEPDAPDLGVSVAGMVTSLSPRFSGDLSGTLNAPLAVELAGAYFDRSLAAVEAGGITFQLHGGDGAEGVHDVRLDVAGKIDGADLTLRAAERRAGEGSPRLELSMTISDRASDPVSQFLPRLLQLPAGAVVEKGELLVTLVGDRGGELETALLYRAAGSSLSLKGNVEDPFGVVHFAGRFEAKADTYRQLANQFALSGEISDLIDVNGRGGAVLATGDLDWRSTDLSLRDVEAVAGSFRVSGEATADWQGEMPKLTAELDLGRIALDHFLENDDEEVWSAHPLDWAFLGRASGSFNLEAVSVDVAGLSFEEVSTVGALEDGVLSFSPLTARFGDGRVTMGLRVEGGVGIPGVGLTLAVENTELDAATKMLFGSPLAAGSVTGNLQLEGRGRSQLGLVSTLTGRGGLQLRSGSFAGFDLTAFRKGLEGLQDIAQLSPLVDLTLLKGANGFDFVEGEIELDEGVLKFTGESGEVTGASSTKVEAFADLVRGELDLETGFVLVGEKPLPPLTMVLGGPFRDLSRKFDVLNVQAAIAQRLLIDELKASGVDDVPDELLDLIVSPDAPSELDAPLDDALPVNKEESFVAPVRVPVPAPDADGKKDEGSGAAGAHAGESVAPEEATGNEARLPRLKPQQVGRR
ncbi:MAG: AsmA family protein [Parvibaculum sp.]